jgi:hypothetical protein
MGLRLAMQPFWVRALINGIPFAVLFAALSSLSWSGSRPWVSAIWFLVMGVFVGLAMAYTGQSRYSALTEAVTALDGTGRSQAIVAVTDGAVPADPAVRASAYRLGAAYLGWKSDAQLKRRERQTWLILPVLVALAVVMMTRIGTSTYQTLCFGVLLVLLIVTTPLEVLRTRRIQQNVALLAEGPISQ